eukprot:c17258_g1_i2.p1 GENE.c17258_g1_i2~~c17258_g1_i2.p1  ORF type:complete len:1095 (+),score=285.16 c17258_g1_i2:488-3286(+)
MTTQVGLDNSTLRMELETTRKLVAALEEKVDGLQSQHSVKDSRITAITTKATLFSEQVNTLRKTLGDKGAAIGRAEASVKSLQEDIDRLNSEILDKSNKVVEAEARSSKREAEARVVEEKTHKLQQVTQSQAATIAQLESGLEELKTRASSLEAQVAAKQSTISKIMQEKQDLQAEILQLKEQLAKLEIPSADAGSKPTGGAGVQDEATQLRALLATNDASIRSLTAQLQQAQIEDIPRLKAENDLLTKENSELKSSYSTSRTSENQNVAKLNESRAQISTLSSQVLKLQAEVKDLKLQLAEESATAKKEAKDALDARARLSEVEKLYTGTSTLLQDVSKQIDAKERAMEKAKAELNLLKENSLAENKDRVTALDDRIAAAEISLAGRDQRLANMMEQLRIEREQAQQQHEQFSQMTEKLNTLEKVDLQAKEDEIALLRDQLERLEISNREKDTRLSMMQDKFSAQREELRIRVEQSRLVFDKLKGKEEELRIIMERNSFLETQSRSEQSTTQGLQVRLDATTQAWEKARSDLVTARLTIKDLEEKLETAKDELQTQTGEADLSKSQMESSVGTVKAKEKRIESIQSKLDTTRNDLKTRDEKILELTAQTQKLQSDLSETRSQLAAANLSADQARQRQAALEEDLSRKNVEISNLGATLQSKLDQMQILNGRVSSARDDASQEIQLMKSKIEATEAELKQVSDSVGVTLLQIAASDQGNDSVNERLRNKLAQTEALVRAKENLIALLEDKFASAKLEYMASEAALNSLTVQLQARVSILDKAASAEQSESMVATEKLAVKEAELEVQKKLVAELQAVIASSESNTTGQEQQATRWREMFEELQAEHSRLVETQRRVPQDGGDSTLKRLEFEIEDLRVMYFQSVCLLVKTQLFNSGGQLHNVMVKDLYDEVTTNNLSIEEWPAYIFARTYSHT